MTLSDIPILYYITCKELNKDLTWPLLQILYH